MKAKEHPKAPHNQPFQFTGRKNLTKSKAWWQRGSHNNPPNTIIKSLLDK